MNPKDQLTEALEFIERWADILCEVFPDAHWKPQLRLEADLVLGMNKNASQTKYEENKDK